MKNVFDFNRFGKYFVYDLKNAWYNGGISLILFACLPAAFVFIGQMFTLLTVGHFDTGNQVMVMQILGFIAAITATIIALPVKFYGNITEKRYGSNWLMLPASTFEKWLSMILLLCVVLPIVLSAGLLSLDAVLSLIFGGYYHGEDGAMMVANLGRLRELTELTELSGTLGGMNIDLASASYFEWVETALVFALGAVYFKRAKVAKTILALMGLGFASLMIMLPILTHVDFDSFVSLADRISGMTPDQVAGAVKTVAILIEAVLICAVAGGLYARLRTLKH